jgi:hypothetical protein
MAKRTQDNQKTICVTSWWSPLEYERLVSRRDRTNAKTDSACLRAAVLTGAESQTPAFETLRDWRNEVSRLAGVLESCPSSKLRDETLAEAKAALGRMCL